MNPFLLKEVFLFAERCTFLTPSTLTTVDRNQIQASFNFLKLQF